MHTKESVADEMRLSFAAGQPLPYVRGDMTEAAAVVRYALTQFIYDNTRAQLLMGIAVKENKSSALIELGELFISHWIESHAEDVAMCRNGEYE